MTQHNIPFIYRFRSVGAAIATVGVVVLLLWIALMQIAVDSRRAALLQQPDPLPEWILALGPKPGDSLPVGDARFGEATSESVDPFWPGYGVVCVQLAGEIISFNELQSKVRLSLNGYPITEVGTSRLWYGWNLVDGFILTSRATASPDASNVCLRMILDPGDYLVSLQIESKNEGALKYEWAFQLR